MVNAIALTLLLLAILIHDNRDARPVLLYVLAVVATILVATR